MERIRSIRLVRNEPHCIVRQVSDRDEQQIGFCDRHSCRGIPAQVSPDSAGFDKNQPSMASIPVDSAFDDSTAKCWRQVDPARLPGVREIRERILLRFWHVDIRFFIIHERDPNSRGMPWARIVVHSPRGAFAIQPADIFVGSLPSDLLHTN